MFDFHQIPRDEDGERDEEAVSEYIDGLIEAFAASPEAQPLRDAEDSGFAAMMLEYGFNYLGVAPSEMSLNNFNEVLFELFPRKVSVEAEKAGAIVAELRAFWNFVARQYGLANARTIAATLDDRAAKRLHKALADPANYGMAKSFFMSGTKAGFDMTTQEGLSAFQSVFNAQLQARGPEPLGADFPADEGAFPALPFHERPTGDALKKKRKEKRKQREAKKRNRR